MQKITLSFGAFPKLSNTNDGKCLLQKKFHVCFFIFKEKQLHKCALRALLRGIYFLEMHHKMFEKKKRKERSKEKNSGGIE